ncbi:MAG TPA: 3-deoxy-manno-octulosonate cytidylyltransferase [Chitinophagales bacterium]|nr:3-deoxy-manno-octulosonate cytidylyltransferase [Chitinophagales bacterium]
MKVIGIIPSRYGSTRFPGKPLADMMGKTMIRRVYERAIKAKMLDWLVVATDDERIMHEVKNFGGRAVMTSPEHLNGTERCAEVAEQFNAEVVINVQGDEPFIDPAQIDLLANLFKNNIEIATLIKEQPLNEELQNPARVKVVVNKNMEALYFSRSLIPFLRDHPHFSIHGFNANKNKALQHELNGTAVKHIFYKHIGIYGYRKDVLRQIVKLAPSPLEEAENLEQLRWLENGYKIKCAVTDYDPVSIDTPDDLQVALKSVKKFK